MEILFRVRSELGTWRMLGASAFSEWLTARPWTSVGGVRCLRVGDASTGEALADLIRRSVRATDDGASGVQIAHVSDPLAFDDPLGVLAEAAGCVLSRGPRREQIRALARALDHPPWVFVFDACIGLSPVRALVTLSALIEDFRKVACPVTLIVLTRDPAGESDDFVHGAPWAPMPSGRVDHDWTWYLRCRIAWESAGRIDLAAAWWPEAIGAEDDRGVEATLDARATTHWQSVPERLRDDFSRWAVAGRLTPDGLPRFRESGLVWQPAGLSSARISPWAARALLLAGDTAAGDTLRLMLSCVPLTRELLARCVDLERRQRERYSACGVVRPETDAIARRYALPGSRERSHYSTPLALPRDPWSFAPFGEYLAAAPIGGHPRELLDDLRALRNHLAHGHFVGWRAVRELRRLEAALE